MPGKGTTMSESHKERIRIGTYRRVYGPDWEQIVQAKQAAKQSSYAKPVYSPDFLGKRELLRLIIAKLRDSATATREFAVLAKLYCGIKHWLQPNPEWVGQGRKSRAQKALEQPPQPQDLNELIRRIESTRKQDTNGHFSTKR